jgi:DHA1 family multidrug resistance protein-like MFS transporter
VARHSQPASQVLYWPILVSMLAYGLLIFMLPIYARDLQANAFEIGGLFTAFSITALAARPLVGWGLDRLGRKSFLLAAFLGYALSLAVMALAGNLLLLYVSRLIQGVASSFMWITAYTIATDLSPAGERGRSVALVDAASAQGMLFGSIPGWIALLMLPIALAWPWMFAGYALAALFATWLAWRTVPETKSLPATSPAKAGVPQQLHPYLYRLMAIVFITGMTSAMVAPIWLVFIQDHFTQDLRAIVWAYLPSALVYGFLPPRLGPLSDRLGRTPMMTLGLALSGLVSLALPALTRLPNGLWVLAVLWVLEAAGFVMASPAQEALVADLTGADQRGRGYGMYTFAAGLGAAAGPLLGGWLYDAVSQAAPFYLNGSAMIFCAVLVALLLGGLARKAGTIE